MPENRDSRRTVDDRADELAELIDAEPRPDIEDILRPLRALHTERVIGTPVSVGLMRRVLHLAADERFTTSERLQLHRATRSLWEDDPTLARLAETRIVHLQSRIREEESRDATRRESTGLALALRRFEADLAVITSVSILRGFALAQQEAGDNRRHLLVLIRIQDVDPTPSN